MSVLVDKSNENYESAVILLENKKYASSIHCSYYSSNQLLSDKINNSYKKKSKKFFKELSSENAKNSKNKKDILFYEFLVSEYLEELSTDIEKAKASELLNIFSEVFHIRKLADYCNKSVITKEQAEIVIDNVLNINDFLKTKLL